MRCHPVTRLQALRKSLCLSSPHGFSGDPRLIALCILCFAFCIFQTSIIRASETAGTTYPFLDLQLTPRAQSLGGAFTALGNDAGAVLQNPAGLAQVHFSSVELMQTQPVFDSDYYLLTAQFEGGWGLAWSQQTMSNIALTATTSATVTSDVLADGYSAYLANALTLAKAVEVNDALSLGAALSGFYQDFSGIDYGKGYGAALTLGLLWDAADFRVGGTLKDMLNLQRWNNGTWERAASELRLGVAKSLGTDWDASVETRCKLSATPVWSLHAGAELRLLDLAALRLGYDDGVLTTGVGLLLGFTKLDCSYESSSTNTYAERVRVSAGVIF